MGKVVCPKCEKDDQIQKVTSIVAGGISVSDHQVVSAYGRSSGTSVSQTQLAQRLSPPKKPDTDWLSGIQNANVGSFSFFILALIVGGICQVSVGAMGMNPNGSIVPFLIGAFLPMAGVFWLFISLSQRAKKTIPDWEKQISNWGKLYYCYRDDCVFNPETHKYISPEGMDKLLQ